MTEHQTLRGSEDVAFDIVDSFSWSSNVMFKGRLVGQQYPVADAIAAEIEERDRYWQARILSASRVMRERCAQTCRRLEDVTMLGRATTSQRAVGKARAGAYRDAASAIRALPLNEE